MNTVARLLAFVVVVVAPTVCSAQSADTATLLGMVSDAQGSGVPGASVAVTNVDTGLVRNTVSDASGSYRVPALPPGRYEVSASFTGFRTLKRTGLTFSAASEHVLNLTLAVGEVREDVTVTAEVPVVDTTSAAVSTTWNREQIDLLPLIGRSVTSLLSVAPGATESGDGVAFGGSRGRSNQYVVDGVDNSADISGGSRQPTLLDALYEFQVIVNGYKAEYGRASGGFINVVTRAGTNRFTGDAFWLFRNQDMIARNPFATTGKDPFQRIHYGGAVGGPIRRNRTHFFTAYERQDRDTISTTSMTLPASTDPFSAATLEYFRRSGIDPAVFGAGGNTRLVRPEYVDVHKASGRVDEQLSSSQNLMLKVAFDRDNEPSGVSSTIYDFNGAVDYERNASVTISDKWILGGGRLNELSGFFNQDRIDSQPSYPAVVNISAPGFSLGASTNYPQARTDNIWQIVDSHTIVKAGTRTGEHVLKGGIDFKMVRSNGYFDSNFRGTYSFTTLNDFVLGRPSRFTRNQGNSQLKRPNELYGLFAQDDWRLGDSVTLNLGMRYDYESAKTEALKDVTGEAGPGISRDKNNVSPRLGFVWAPDGSTKQAFHGSSGIYYDQVILNVQGNARFTPPKVIGIQLDNPTFPDPSAGTPRTLVPSVSIIDPDLVTPYNWNTTVGYRRELPMNIGVDVSYVHNRGYDQIGIVNANAGIPGTASLSGAGTVRPDPNFTNKSFYSNLGWIKYHALQIEMRKRYSHRYQGALNYTLSRTRDNVFNFLDQVFVPEMPELNVGPGSEDRTHRFSGHLEFSLPWNFQLGTLMEFTSARPWDIFAGSRDLNGDGITGDWVEEKICRNIACPGFHYSRNSVRELSLTEANRLRSLLGLSDIERVDNPRPFKNVDVTLQRSVRFGNGQAARFTIEAYNVFNWPTYAMPSGNIASSLFGQITNTDSTRTFSSATRALQVTLQYDF